MTRRSASSRRFPPGGVIPDLAIDPPVIESTDDPVRRRARAIARPAARPIAQQPARPAENASAPQD
jgi:hypothetical protein